jgi:hypothetical protein
VWNDSRNGADCADIDTWRQALEDGKSPPAPAPEQQCPPTASGNFGNSDIYGGVFAPAP